MLIALQILAFSFAVWFGMVLVARNLTKPGLRFAGLGLMAYAFALALDILDPQTRWGLAVAILPTICWLGAVWHLLPVERRAVLPGRSLQIVILATGSFLLGLLLLTFPPAWLSDSLVLLAIGFDFALLGYAIIVLDAYDEGETLLPDLLRSFSLSLFTVLIFVLQILAIVAISDIGLTTPIRLLLLGTITTAILIQTFSDTIQTLLERIAFAWMPQLRQARAELRTAAQAITRRDDSLDLMALNEAEFTRLTRRALSHMGDLGRLAANPLTRLPAIDTRLAAKGQPHNTLERAVELKSLLTESIARLKPQNKGDFGTTDEWRHYNALYFPYVVGLKPYSRRDSWDKLDADSKAALDWFAVSVPERTLYNWQNAAARLVAQQLRELH